MIFFPKISVPFHSSQLDNLPYSLNIKEQMILLPLTLLLHVIFFQKALKFTTWNSSPRDLINFPPMPQGGGLGTLYTPVYIIKQNPGRSNNCQMKTFCYVSWIKLCYISDSYLCKNGSEANYDRGLGRLGSFCFGKWSASRWHQVILCKFIILFFGGGVKRFFTYLHMK